MRLSVRPVVSELSGGGDNLLEVAANGGACSWLAISYADWISVDRTAPATGTGLVILSVSSNPNPVSRTGTVRIAGSSAISQGASEGVGLASADPGPTINVAAVQLMINEALGISPPVDDLNQDGVVNLCDIRQVIKALSILQGITGSAVRGADRSASLGH